MFLSLVSVSSLNCKLWGPGLGFLLISLSWDWLKIWIYTKALINIFEFKNWCSLQVLAQRFSTFLPVRIPRGQLAEDSFSVGWSRAGNVILQSSCVIPVWRLLSSLSYLTHSCFFLAPLAFWACGSLLLESVQHIPAFWACHWEPFRLTQPPSCWIALTVISSYRRYNCFQRCLHLPVLGGDLGRHLWHHKALVTTHRGQPPLQAAVQGCRWWVLPTYT